MTKSEKFSSTVAHFFANESGATAVEYAIVASGVGAFVVATVYFAQQPGEKPVHHAGRSFSNQRPAFSPAEISCVRSASARRVFAEPALSGCC
jgi:hypothetical protein